MPAFECNSIFVRMQCYAITPGGKRTPSAKQVIDEGLRSHARGCRHVTYPMRPYTAFKGNLSPETFYRRLTQLIDDTQTKTGLKTPRNASVLLGGVASYPGFTHEVEQQEEYFDHFSLWSQCVMRFLEAEFGENLDCVMWHFDELHPHVHFWAMGVEHNGRISASELHPGRKAHKEFANFCKAMDKALDNMRGKGMPCDGQEEAYAELKTLGHMGVYRNAMAALQDRFYEYVGKPCGLTRRGELPRKFRFTRKPGRCRPIGPAKEWRADRERKEAMQQTARLTAHWEIPLPKRPGT